MATIALALGVQGSLKATGWCSAVPFSILFQCVLGPRWYSLCVCNLLLYHRNSLRDESNISIKNRSQNLCRHVEYFATRVYANARPSGTKKKLLLTWSISGHFLTSWRLLMASTYSCRPFQNVIPFILFSLQENV